MKKYDWKPLVAVIPSTISSWFVALIQHCASEHEMSMPLINLTSCDDYKHRVAAEFKLAGNLEGAASIPASELDGWCRLAVEDLVRIRTICRAYKEGRLALEELRQLPLYGLYHDYFDESPSLVQASLVTALAKRQHVLDEGPAALKKPAEAVLAQQSLSIADFQHFVAGIGPWYDAQVVGLAIKEELQGGANPDPSKQAFLAEALQHLYENVLLEAQAGHFVLSCEDSEKLCRRIAEDAYELRRLYGLWSSGKISKRKLRCTPLYRRQQEYFDRPPMFRNMVSYAEQMMETRRVQRN